VATESVSACNPCWVNLQTLATNKGNTPSNGLDMLDLDRFFESANDDSVLGDNASWGVIFDKYREFSALARRLEADETSLGMDAFPRVGGVMGTAVATGEGTR
jgi:hypothetical protein